MIYSTYNSRGTEAASYTIKYQPVNWEKFGSSKVPDCKENCELGVQIDSHEGVKEPYTWMITNHHF